MPSSRLRVDVVQARLTNTVIVDDSLQVNENLAVTGNVTIGGGTITGITDLAVADGGTGASTASGARTNLDVYSTSEVAALVAALWTTGDVKVTFKTVADTGWVLMNDGTIGDASSGATTRANADTSALFTLLWTNTVNADCAVSSGRGGSAAADFAAHKTIALPKALGRGLAISGAGSGLTSRALASVLGAETKTIGTTNLPASGLSIPGLSVPGLSIPPLGAGTLSVSPGFSIDGAAGGAPGAGVVTNVTPGTYGVGGSTSSGTTGTGTTGTGTTGNMGSGTALDIMNPRFHAQVMIKL